MMNTLPYSYQIKGARKIHEFKGRVLLADSMGLGKSAQALMYQQRHPEISPVIIVCPASLKYNWENEALKHFNLKSEILFGSKNTRKTKKKNPLITIVNYDILTSWMEYLLSLNAQYLIIDEGHLLGNRNIKRTKAVKHLSLNIPHIVALTGTPITNKPTEMWALLNIIRPDLFPSFYSFANRYSKRQRKPWGVVYSGCNNMKELNEILTREVMIRRRKQDVIKELPVKQRIILPVEIEDRKDYAHANQDFLNWLATKYRARLANAERAAGLTKIGYLRRLVAQLKLKSILEWIDSFLINSDEKLIVFGVHREILNTINQRYSKISVLINGSVTLNERKIREHEFQNDNRIRLFLGNIKAAGVGLNLTAASTVLFAELGWTPTEMIQAEDRCFARLNDLHGASVYYVIGKSTIEERILKILQDKQEIADNILDNEVNVTLNIFDMLCQQMLQEK